MLSPTVTRNELIDAAVRAAPDLDISQTVIVADAIRELLLERGVLPPEWPLDLASMSPDALERELTRSYNYHRQVNSAAAPYSLIAYELLVRNIKHVFPTATAFTLGDSDQASGGCVLYSIRNADGEDLDFYDVEWPWDRDPDTLASDITHVDEGTYPLG